MSREKIKKNQETCNAVVQREIQAQAREPPEEPASAVDPECMGCPYAVKPDGTVTEFKCSVGALTDPERQIITDGCLINYYRNNK